MAGDFDFIGAGEPRRARVVAWSQPAAPPKGPGGTARRTARGVRFVWAAAKRGVVARLRRQHARDAARFVWAAAVLAVVIGLLSRFEGIARDVWGYGPTAKPYTSRGVTTPAPPRDQIAAALKGRDEAFILNAAGRPARTLEAGTGAAWFYKGFSYDPATKTVDAWTVLNFTNGVVTGVSFLGAD